MVVMQFDFGPVRVVFAWRSSGLGEFFGLGWGGEISSAWLPFSTLLGEERLIRAVAEIMLSSPLTWLCRKEALDTVFKERRSSRREISEAQGLRLCAHNGHAVGRLGKVSCFNSKMRILGVQKSGDWPT